MERQSVVILGAGRFAQEVADLFLDLPQYCVTAFVQHGVPAKDAETLLGHPVLCLDDAPEYAADHLAMAGIGTMVRRLLIKDVERLGFEFAVAVHPAAHISTSSEIEAGCLASAGVIVGSNTRVGRHVILNRGALVGHHTRIGDHSILGPGANVAGSCCIGRGVHIGMGAVVLNDLNVGDNSVVGSGAVVTKDVPANVQVLGLPASIVKVLEQPSSELITMDQQ